ncbi:SpoIIE family protein phosphatase [bacterium]|nr:SpoIIE family protein phosphatase [bacterium]
MELKQMLTEVANAACEVMQAERCTVWLYDDEAKEYVTEVVIGMESIRIPSDRGLVGSCGDSREVINVPDCYADSRFDPSTDKESGYRTRCLLSVPLVGLDDKLIGVLQILNRKGGPFDDADVETATALSAQSAVALQRARMLEDLLVKERLEQELGVARQIQTGTFPRRMPKVEGYDIHGVSYPAEETGGDTFDIIEMGGELGLLLADATGHGVGPALSVTQVRSMLRMSAHLGCDLKIAFEGINRQLQEDLPPERFVTAFLGILEPESHRVRYISGGQGPLFHFHAATGKVDEIKPTTMPMGVLANLPDLELQFIDMAPGDIFALITDGILEAENTVEEDFGVDRTLKILSENHERDMKELVSILVEETREFMGGGAQADDMTILLLKRRS